MERRVFTRQVLLSNLAILCYLAAFKLVLHLLTNGHYGYFRDELYYIACSDHLDWGYVDQPPLIALLTKAARLALGDSLQALRFLPAVAGALLVRYEGFLGLKGMQTERNRWGQLPQHFADMFGWEEMVATVARAYHHLPPEDKARCAIFADNYGEAGAIDFFGEKYGLPKTISGHQNYYLWGPRDYTGECLITVGSDLEDLQPLFERVEPAATFTNEYVMPYENDLTIYTCRQMRTHLKQYWPKIKCYSC